MNSLFPVTWTPKIGDVVEFRLEQDDDVRRLGKVVTVSGDGFCEVRPLHRSQPITLALTSVRLPRKVVSGNT